ncbi:Flp pilus assembly protein CpaB [Celeribacter indicus]|uniref:Pilus assembly protein CpaB n=1 Tax=Celeribacter indicus TaxID=1208324 RepID=A0A0B5E0P0_9RHOB|nr:Flp pilus assembly protein CpaB [Celeribacter indicus]AJE48834.1 pilus assembly protein CpaB [Celeribacter indicus]SDW38665.1 pilus assembly protein CpaB [Celeribacter indicus]
MFSRLGISGRAAGIVASSVAVAAVVTWIGIGSMSSPSRGETPAATDGTRPVPLPVLAAASTLDAGTPVTAEALTIVNVDPSEDGAFYLRDTAENRTRLEGLVLSRRVPARTPFVAEDLDAAPSGAAAMPGGQDSGTAALLAEGMRAISLPVTEETAVAGLITRGDRVDVLVTYDVPDGLRAVRTVLRNVRVIATDRTTEVSGERPDSPPQTVTLELHPEGTKVLALALRTGNLVLALSPASDSDMPEIAEDEPLLSNRISGMGQAALEETQRSVEIVRGTASTQRIAASPNATAGALTPLMAGQVASPASGLEQKRD